MGQGRPLIALLHLLVGNLVDAVAQQTADLGADLVAAWAVDEHGSAACWAELVLLHPLAQAVCVEHVSAREFLGRLHLVSAYDACAVCCSELLLCHVVESAEYCCVGG